MNKNYGNKKLPKTGNSGSGSLWVGLLIGLLVGIAFAVALALFLNRGANPFIQKHQRTRPDAISSAQVMEPVQPEILKPGSGQKEPPISEVDEPHASGPERFDFYKVLPGALDASSARATRPPLVKQGHKEIWLQAGAFQSEQEADNLKARLALLGFEARIQTLETPDKALWHRVRVGPFNTISEMNKAQELLSSNGIEAAVTQK